MGKLAPTSTAWAAVRAPIATASTVWRRYSASMADTGEQELNEEEIPFMQIVAKKIMKDNQAFGKYRGGQGYEMIARTHERTILWGFMVCCIGSKVSCTPGCSGVFLAHLSVVQSERRRHVYEIIRESRPAKWDLLDRQS